MLAWAVYTSKFFPIHKSGELGFLKRLRCTTLVGNTVSKYRWGYKLLAIKAAPPAPKLNPLPLVSLQYETNRTCEAAKASLCLDSSHMYYHFPNNWLVQIFFYLYDKALILKCSLILSNTNTKIWDKKWVWSLCS